VVVGGDAGPPGASEGKDMMRGDEMSSMVQVAAWIASWRGASAPPEHAVDAESKRAIQQPGGMIACEAWCNGRGGRGV
jgi:hypothetical protein